jgi:hypothetical protein
MLTIVKQLGQLSRDLDDGVNKLADLEFIAVEAEGDFKVAFAAAFRDAVGSVEDRKQAAVMSTDQLWRVFGKAAAAVRLQKEHIRALHARIDVGRTIQSTARAEMQLAGGQL